MIRATFPYQKRRQRVLGLEMAYVDVGAGDPIVFLHGNPTSSYIWRNIIPYVQDYRRPFAEPGEARRPTLTWPRQLPVDGEPADVTEIVAAYGAWLSRSDVPKLYIQGDPGRLQPSQHAFCRTWPAQSEVIVLGLHNLQEDSPDAIGQAIASWMQHLKEDA
jgi:pimeloyl-ACP methyl ester carboxylesterase